MKALALTLILAVASIPRAFGADLSNDDLAKACDRKMLSYNSKGERVGGKLDSYCSGYLQATLHALRNSPKVKCASITDESPEYLLSVYLTYRKEKSAKGTGNASATLLAAYRRAFACESL
jgi:hypothetical protein